MNILRHLVGDLTYGFAAPVRRGETCPFTERAVEKDLESSLVETSRSIDQAIWSLKLECGDRSASSPCG